ncbi:hypothetical protein F5888DRAFT_1808106 [Russula emetica]|nr:hypothetical protein F5888DRAFT_1808106 [Russula emetica]
MDKITISNIMAFTSHVAVPGFDAVGWNFHQGLAGGPATRVRELEKDVQYSNSPLLELLIDDLPDVFLLAYLTALASNQKLNVPLAECVPEAFKVFSTVGPAEELDA